jgi:insulysin
MLVQAFYDATEDDRYYAGRAGLSCRVTSSTNNADFEVNFAGFTDKLAEYVETILSNLKTFKPDPKRFPQILDKAKRAYESQEFTKPWELLASRVSYVVRSVAWATDELLDELKRE